MILGSNKNDIYIETYFEETLHCSKNLSNILTNAELVSLKERDFFNSFEEVKF
ncbi:21005_t:CDS:2 [Cetraspora pellucida]|uniref:21005_t:CDS:1 n=1 Tax=Cetraspora pellucida TaxID=1433469 RepID=A0A9N9AMQ9_9GLOM|nr:21005_t:CDS:2 [Cetraspora pellucida]